MKRNNRLNLNLRDIDRDTLDAFLWCRRTNRVPYGAYLGFFTARLHEFFSWQRLELEPYGLPPGYFVCGPKEMLSTLSHRLSGVVMVTMEDIVK